MGNFWDLVNIEQFWEKREGFQEERGDVSFFCKDCHALVETKRPNPSGYKFICTLCSWKNIALWTEAWLKEMYKIKK